MSPIKILVDADACPVKEEIYRVALRREVPVQVVSNSPHPRARPSADRAGGGVATRSTPPTTGSPSSADAQTVVVTGDILLADRCLKEGATVIGHNGKPFTSREHRRRHRDARDHGRLAQRAPE